MFERYAQAFIFKTKWFSYETFVDLAPRSILHLRVIAYSFPPVLVPHGDFTEMFPMSFMRLYVARAKSETIIYNVFPLDVWLTPWVNETLASPVYAQNGYLIIHLLLSSCFSFPFYDSTSRRYVGVKRGLWNHGGPTQWCNPWGCSASVYTLFPTTARLLSLFCIRPPQAKDKIF